MKFYVVMMFVCLLGGNVFGQGDLDDWEQRVEGDLTLLELITESTIIHQLTDVKDQKSAWTALV